MKKVIFILLCVLMILLISCNVTPPETTTAPETTDIDENETRPSEETSIKFICYVNDWMLFTTKTIGNSSTATDLIDRLAKLNPTGEKSMKMSDKPFDMDDYTNYDPYIYAGTTWLEIGDKIYRVYPASNTISLVERHYGEGEILDAPDDLIKDIINAYQYYPHDYYTGNYSRSDGVLSLDHVYTGKTDVTVSIKSIKLASSDSEPSVITLELVSTEDKTFNLSAETYQGDDIVGGFATQVVELKVGEKKTVELSLYAWSCSMYSMNINIDNTVIDITVDSRYASIDAFDRVDMDLLVSYLDSEGFVNGLSQARFCDLIDDFFYQGKCIRELVNEMNYDGELVYGLEATGELFGYGNDYTENEYRTYAYSTNYFYTSVNVDGLTLPRGISFGDTLGEVIAKLSGTNAFSEFVADEGSYIEMTLYVSGDMVLTLNKASGDKSYTLNFRHTSKFEDSYGNTVFATRSVTFDFDSQNQKLVNLKIRMQDRWAK